MCVVLFPVFAPPLTTAVGSVIVLAVVLSFIWDGLITTSMLDLQGERYRRLTEQLQRWRTIQVPIALRIGIVGCSVWYLLSVWFGSAAPLTVVQTFLTVGLAVSSGLMGIGWNRWPIALSVLSISAFLTLFGSTTPALLVVTASAFLFMMIYLGDYM